MTRRELLTGMLVAGFWGAIKNLGYAAQVINRHGIEGGTQAAV